MTTPESTPWEEEFKAFIIKWCGESAPHLLDSDENDAERFRDSIRTLLTTQREEIRAEFENCPQCEGLGKVMVKEALEELVRKVEGMSIDFSKKTLAQRKAMDEGDIGYMNGVNDAVDNVIKVIKEV